jgi:hypothetical protein
LIGDSCSELEWGVGGDHKVLALAQLV